MTKLKNKKCPICNSSTTFMFSTKYTNVNKCESIECGHLFSIDSRPNIGIHEHEVNNVEIFSRRNIHLAKKLKRMGLVFDGAQVLDVGAGLGHISSEIVLQGENVNITCVEAAPIAINYLNEKGFKVIESLDMIKPEYIGYFDTILMVELIEHIDDPLALLAACKSVLSPGGCIFLTTPCGELRSRSHKTAAYNMPEHVQFFTERSLTNALMKAGFSSVKYVELREFHAGSRINVIKFLKDSLRIARNLIQGKHHLVAIIN